MSFLRKRKDYGALKQKVTNLSRAADLPYPDLERTLLVDADGNVIHKRSPQPGDFYARPTMWFAFGGTIPVFDPKDHPKERAQSARIAYETEELRNRELLDKAVLYLSQTDDGRRLLSRAREMGFTIVFDRRTTEARSAAGLCDFNNKLIPIHPETTPQNLMLTLKHELQHMENIADGISADTQESLTSFQKVNRALEAAARVSEAIAVYECSAVDPRGTPHQFRPPGVSQAFAQKLPQMAAAANSVHAQKAATAKDWAGFAQTVFPAFFKEEKTLASYDKDMVSLFSKDMPRDMNDAATISEMRVTYGRDHISFSQAFNAYSTNFPLMLSRFMRQSSWTHTRIAERLTIGGKKFLDASGKDFNLDDPAKVAFANDAMSATALQTFQEKIARLQANGHDIPAIDLPEISATPSTARVGGKLLSKMLAGVWPSPPSPSVAPSPASTLQAIIMPNIDAREAWKHDVMLAGSQQAWAPEMLARFGTALLRTTQPAYTRSPNDKTLFAIMDYAHAQRAGISNNAEVTACRELVDMGLRAPISAFPEAYIKHLYARVIAGASSASKSEEYALFTDSEKRLLQHWQDIAAHGVSAFDGNALPGHRSPDQGVEVYGRSLAQRFPVAASARPVAIMSVTDIDEHAKSLQQAKVASAQASARTTGSQANRITSKRRTLFAKVF